LIKLDENMDFNGYHTFLKNNPEFQLQPSKDIKSERQKVRWCFWKKR